MTRETKFNYGFLLVSLGVPLIADYFVGRKFAVIAAIVITALGVLFLLWGHQHREKNEPPRNRWRRALIFGMASAILGVAAIGIGAVLKKKEMTVLKSQEVAQPAAQQAPPVSQLVPPLPPQPSKQKPNTAHKRPTSQDNSVHLRNDSKIEQQSSGNCSPNIVGGANTVECGPPPPPIPNVKACVSYPNDKRNDQYQTKIVFSTDNQIPRPWFALVFDGPVSGDEMVNPGGSEFQRAEKLPNPERSAVFRLVSLHGMGGSGTFPGDGPITLIVFSKDRVKLLNILHGAGDDPDGVFTENLSYGCD